jgi:hypothetical protein
MTIEDQLADLREQNTIILRQLGDLRTERQHQGGHWATRAEAARHHGISVDTADARIADPMDEESDNHPAETHVDISRNSLPLCDAKRERRGRVTWWQCGLLVVSAIALAWMVMRHGYSLRAHVPFGDFELKPPGVERAPDRPP